MTRRVLPLLSLLIALAAIPSAQTTERLDHATIAQIRDEGLSRSQVMDHIGWLSDVYGPRLTGGPAVMQASNWTIAKFNEWGLANAHRETWPFGKGWSLVRFSAPLIAPQIQPLIGYPGSWTPGTSGTVTADVVRVQIDSDADFEKYRGTLAGRIVLTQPERPVPLLEGLIVHRMGPKDFAEAATTPAPAARGSGAGRRGRGARSGRGNDNTAGRRGSPSDKLRANGEPAEPSLATRIAQFYKAEGVVAALNRGSDSVMASVGS